MRRNNAKTAGMMGLAIGAALLPGSTEACMYHWLRGLPEPNGIWPASPGDPSGASPPTDAASAVQQMQQQDALDDAAVNNAVISKGTLAGSTLAGNTLTGGTLIGGTLIGGTLIGGTLIGGTLTSGSLTGGSIAGGSISGGSLSGGNLADGNGSTTTPFLSPRVTPANNPPGAPTDPAITAWLVNVTNTYAYSTNAAIEADVTGILANVGTDAYSSSEVYIYATGLPSYNIGPFGNDPNAPTNQKRTFEISLSPTPATTHTATGLGPIGMAVNGVAIFNPWDGNYYNVSNGHVGTSPVVLSDLLEMHTKKIHLLINDQSLGDYHHEHPVPTDMPGEYAFDFTPQKPGPYRIWADVVPAASSIQEYVIADIPAASKPQSITDRTTVSTAVVNGRKYVLALNTDGQPIRANQTVIGTISITESDGSPTTSLEPVMGSFAHIVGFNEDRKTVLHIHPYGKEPASTTDRAGPAFAFKFYSPTPGFYRLYGQVQIDGVSQFAPFALTVLPAR